jgi:hypothetical protein
MDINLHIERLILDGLPIERNQGPYVQAAIQAELTRLLTEQGMSSYFQTGGTVPRLDANVMQLRTNSNPIQIGAQIAQSVYSEIGNAQRSDTKST